MKCKQKNCIIEHCLPAKALAQADALCISGGFTLIELLAVVSLSVILMMTATSLLISFTTGSLRNQRAREVKSEGTYALSAMKQQLQNSASLVTNSDLQLCENSMNKIAFRALDNGVTEFMLETDAEVTKIASNSGKYLTSESVTIIDDQLNFNCVESPSGDSAYVTISFGLRVGNPVADRAAEVAEQYFTTGVTLRNY